MVVLIGTNASCNNVNLLVLILLEIAFSPLKTKSLCYIIEIEFVNKDNRL